MSTRGSRGTSASLRAAWPPGIFSSSDSHRESHSPHHTLPYPAKTSSWEPGRRDKSRRNPCHLDAYLRRETTLASMNYIEPYIPTPGDIIPKMLTLASVKPDETVFDLGSGDGRMVIAAAKDFHARVVGVELRRRLVIECSDRGKAAGRPLRFHRVYARPPERRRASPPSRSRDRENAYRPMPRRRPSIRRRTRRRAPRSPRARPRKRDLR